MKITDRLSSIMFVAIVDLSEVLGIGKIETVTVKKDTVGAIVIAMKTVVIGIVVTEKEEVVGMVEEGRNPEIADVENVAMTTETVDDVMSVLVIVAVEKIFLDFSNLQVL